MTGGPKASKWPARGGSRHPSPPSVLPLPTTSAKNAKTYPAYDVTHKKRKSKTFQFFSMQTRRLVASFQGLNSSLAKSPGVLGSCKDLPSMGKSYLWKWKSTRRRRYCSWLTVTTFSSYDPEQTLNKFWVLFSCWKESWAYNASCNWELVQPLLKWLCSSESSHSQPGSLRRFRDPIRVPRISNRVSRIRENYHRVPKTRENRVHRIREIGSLQIQTGFLTFSLKKTCSQPKQE